MRILDANFNRAKEGLRVCEDICRFVYDARKLTQDYKRLRHRLTDLVANFGLKKLLAGRNIVADVGKASTPVELKRRDVDDIFYANSQRVKESIRVLEEFAKLFHNGRAAQELKKMRYAVYELERKIVKEYL